MNLPKNIPKDLSSLLEAMATDFPAILHGNLVGIYVWGSLTYDAFDEACSDVDSVGVTRRHLGDRDFQNWMAGSKRKRSRIAGSSESTCASSSTANFSTRRRVVAAFTTTPENSPATDRTETPSSG